MTPAKHGCSRLPVPCATRHWIARVAPRHNSEGPAELTPTLAVTQRGTCPETFVGRGRCPRGREEEAPPPRENGKKEWKGSRQSDAGGTASRQKKKNPKHQKKKKQKKPRRSSPEEAQKKPNQAQAEEAMGGIRLFCWVGFCTLYFVLLAEEAMGSIRQRLELTRAVAVYPSTPKRGEHSRGGHHRPSQLHSFFVCFLGGFVLAGSAGLHVRMICAAPWLPRAVGVVGRWCGMSSWCQNHFGIFPSLFFWF